MGRHKGTNRPHLFERPTFLVPSTSHVDRVERALTPAREVALFDRERDGDLVEQDLLLELSQAGPVLFTEFFWGFGFAFTGRHPRDVHQPPSFSVLFRCQSTDCKTDSSLKSRISLNYLVVGDGRVTGLLLGARHAWPWSRRVEQVVLKHPPVP